MNRLPSLAAGIGKAGFEWNQPPTRPPSASQSDFSTDSDLTFASAPPGDGASSSPKQSSFASQSQAGTSADMPTFAKDQIQGSDEDMAGDAMAEQETHDSGMSDDTNPEQDARAGSLFSAMQTKAPGLTPLRLTPKAEPAKLRSVSLQSHLTPSHPSYRRELECEILVIQLHT